MTKFSSNLGLSGNFCTISHLFNSFLTLSLFLAWDRHVKLLGWELFLTQNQSINLYWLFSLGPGGMSLEDLDPLIRATS